MSSGSSWQKENSQSNFNILMDLEKAFDCILHDLLIAKLHTYGFSEDSLVFFYSYVNKMSK